MSDTEYVDTLVSSDSPIMAAAADLLGLMAESDGPTSPVEIVVSAIARGITLALSSPEWAHGAVLAAGAPQWAIDMSITTCRQWQAAHPVTGQEGEA